MKISTRGRYALRVMIDLAEHSDDGYTAMKAVAERQGVSLKYMEKILPLLVGAGLVEGVTGKRGGYRLTREPQAYKVGDVLRLTEGSLSPVACVDCDAAHCDKAADCRTRPMWSELSKRINDYLDGVTLEDLMQKSEDI